ncbi:MAG: ACT domain-containing protein [Lachnospiraceae bacterium]|nr:ACT domain-containing protein [Lachnospiraceae bacterium]MCR5777874.1 ACT domain-containing protein [Lachnospiraceae bacterium]
MEERKRFFVVTEKAIPDVLIKVVSAKKLLDSGRALSVQEATEAVGISRSSFYKYKDDIFPFHDSAKGMTITISVQMDDEPGLLSDVLKIIAEFKANILTIHQSIPINGVASLSISIQVLSDTGDISDMIDKVGAEKGVQSVRILGKEQG